MTALSSLSFGPAATAVKELFDLNDNGRLGWPDLLASVFFATVGLLGAMVLAGMALGTVVLAIKGVVAAARGLITAVRSQASIFSS